MNISNRACFQSTLLLSSILAVSGLLGILPVASATTIDPTTYPANTDISTATPGVTMSTPGNGNGTDIYAVPFNSLSLNGSFLGYQNDPTPYYSTLFTSLIPLRADFISPVSSVSVSFELDATTGWGAQVYAYNSGGTEIGSGTYTSGPQLVTISAPDISYILAYFTTAQYFPDVAGITSIDSQAPSVSSVPDGGNTLALLATAAIGLFLVRKRATKTA